MSRQRVSNPSMMKLSVEILDRIFSFMVRHRETLFACSGDSALSPILERHLYFHVIVHIGHATLEETDFIGAFKPDGLSKLVSEKPRIRYHVRILQIEVDFRDVRQAQLLDQVANTMLQFPSLECIMLSTPKDQSWCWSDVFRIALEDRLTLPTLRELHLPGSQAFPISLFDHCKNIRSLSLSGLIGSDGGVSSSTLPQLKSLTLSTQVVVSPILTWLLSHSKELQSLKYSPLIIGKELQGLLGACSGTLKTFEIDVSRSLYFDKRMFQTGRTISNSFPKLAPASLGLQQATVYTAIIFNYYDDQWPETCVSWLPAAADAMEFLSSSTPHLILDIDISLWGAFSSLAEIDFLPLAVLGTLSVPRIDVYVHTDTLPSALTRASFFSSLAGCEDVVRSIKEGVLVIHWEESAPGFT